MEIIYNILLFVPLGGILERLRCTKPVLFCIFLSIAIEIIQYLTGLGLAEFDDVARLLEEILESFQNQWDSQSQNGNLFFSNNLILHLLYYNCLHISTVV